MTDQVIIKKLQDKINAATRSNSKDFRITLDEGNKLISEILNLTIEINKLQKKIIDINNEENEIIIAPELSPKKD